MRRLPRPGPRSSARRPPHAVTGRTAARRARPPPGPYGRCLPPGRARVFLCRAAPAVHAPPAPRHGPGAAPRPVFARRVRPAVGPAAEPLPVLAVGRLGSRRAVGWLAGMSRRSTPCAMRPAGSLRPVTRPGPTPLRPGVRWPMPAAPPAPAHRPPPPTRAAGPVRRAGRASAARRGCSAVPVRPRSARHVRRVTPRSVRAARHGMSGWLAGWSRVGIGSVRPVSARPPAPLCAGRRSVSRAVASWLRCWPPRWVCSGC